MPFEGTPPALAPLTTAAIKPPGDLLYARIDKANVPDRLFNNALINPAFEWWQRGGGPFSLSNTAGGVYGPDRWRMDQAGAGTSTISQRALTFGEWPSQSRLSATFGCSGFTGAATDFSTANQRIEGVDTFAGKRVVVRGGIKLISGAVGSKIAIEWAQLFGTGGSAEVDTFMGQVALTAGITPFAVIADIPSMSGKIIGSTGDQVSVNFWLAAGSNYNARTGNIGVQAITIQLVDVEVKEIKPGYGDQYPGFERPPKELDLQRCHRFYQYHYNGSNFYFPNIAGGASTIFGLWFPWDVDMRIPPAVALGGLGTSGVGYAANLPSANSTQRGAFLRGDTASSGGYAYFNTLVANAEF